MAKREFTDAERALQKEIAAGAARLSRKPTTNVIKRSYPVDPEPPLSLVVRRAMIAQAREDLKVSFAKQKK